MPPSLTDNMLQDTVSKPIRVARRVHNDSVELWTARVLHPLLEEGAGVFAVTSTTGRSSSRRTIDTRSLARHRISSAQPLVEQADVLDLALDIPIGVAVLSGTCGPLVENLREVAGAVDDDAEALLRDILG